MELYVLEPPLDQRTITETIVLRETDTYEITVGSWQGQSSGDYTLTIESDMSLRTQITPTATPEGIQAALPGANMGEVPLNGAETWHYQGTPGEIISISIEPDTPYLDPILLLQDKDGVLLASAEGLTIAIEDFEVTENGIYQIVVGSWEGQSEGAYTLIIESNIQAAVSTPAP